MTPLASPVLMTAFIKMISVSLTVKSSSFLCAREGHSQKVSLYLGRKQSSLETEQMVRTSPLLAAHSGEYRRAGPRCTAR